MKLQSKIITLLLPLILLPIILLSAIAYRQINNNFIANSFDKINTLLDQTESLFNLKTTTSISSIKLFSNSSLLKKYVVTDDEDHRYELLQGPLQKLFSSYQKAHPEYYEIRVILPDGYEDTRQTSYNIKNVTEEEQDTPFIKNMMSHLDDIYYETTFNPDTQKISLYVASRLTLRNRAIETLNTPAKLRAYLVITVDLDSIQQQLDKNRIGKSGILFITDNNGTVLFQPKSHQNQELFTNQSADNTDSIRLAENFLSNFTRSIEQNKILKINHGDSTSYIHGRKLNDDLYLLSWLPDNELVIQQRKLQNIVLTIMFFTTLITTGLIFSSLKYFVLRPIYNLEKTARSIGHGDLDNDIKISSNDEIGSLARSLQQMSDSLKTTNERIRYIAYHDSLTGLPNRLMFREYLSRTIASATRNNKKIALLFLDLDNFKWVNDTLGHDVGDQLLKETSDRLENTLRSSDFIAHANNEHVDDVVARLGGDEFIILLTDVSDEFVPGHVAMRILKALSEKVTIDNQTIHVSVSIGITLCPEDSADADELIKNADIAMYHAKKQGKNNYQHFSNSLNDVVSQRLKLENRIREAITNNEFSLLYQPQIDVQNEKIIGVEALLRWNTQDQGMISPVEFIPVAEDSGLILPLGEWVLNETCRQLKAWKRNGLPYIKAAVNVSSKQFAKQDLPEIINKSLSKYSIPSSSLEVELTESIFLNDEKHASDMLFSIRTMGIEVSLDDFGTGYSSLAYLRKFPIDKLKIDRSFVNEISHSREGEEVVTAIIRMAHAMNLKVIAEGVEENNQLSFLKQQGCDYIQGFYFYKPMPADDISSLLHKQRLDSKLN